MKWKLPRKLKKKIPYHKRSNKYWFEYYFFSRRLDVNAMEVCLTYPKWDKEKHEYEFDPKLFKRATNEQLLEWYKKHYPNDKLAHHFCKQNRHRWDKFATTSSI